MLIVIPGKVCTDHRPRRAAHGGMVKSAAYRAYLDSARLFALSQRPRDWDRSGRFEVELTLIEPDRRSRDLDNVKAPLDALTGIAWDDDRQIDRLVVERGEVDKQNPRVVVRVTRRAA